jgi:hypothetical protein
MSTLPTTFLTKIQNHICEKTRKKIVLLSFKKFVKTQFLGVVEYPSIFLIQFFKVPSRFSFQFLNSNFQGSRISFRFLNFGQECYYFQKLVGVVVFTKVRGPTNFWK